MRGVYLAQGISLLPAAKLCGSWKRRKNNQHPQENQQIIEWKYVHAPEINFFDPYLENKTNRNQSNSTWERKPILLQLQREQRSFQYIPSQFAHGEKSRRRNMPDWWKLVAPSNWYNKIAHKYLASIRRDSAAIMAMTENDLFGPE